MNLGQIVQNAEWEIQIKSSGAWVVRGARTTSEASRIDRRAG